MAAIATAIALLAPSAYEADKAVVDVEEPPFLPAVVEPSPAAAIAVGRVSTEDLIMHCRDEQGHWHRLHPNKLMTACGVPFMNWGHANTRSGRYPDPPLAPCDCWTKAERAESTERHLPP